MTTATATKKRRELTRFEIEQKEFLKQQRKIVCPVCLRRCDYFARLCSRTYTTEERRKLIVEFHREVCPNCKVFTCPGKKDLQKCKRQKRDLGDRKFPDWWGETSLLSAESQPTPTVSEIKSEPAAHDRSEAERTQVHDPGSVADGPATDAGEARRHEADGGIPSGGAVLGQPGGNGKSSALDELIAAKEHRKQFEPETAPIRDFLNAAPKVQLSDLAIGDHVLSNVTASRGLFRVDKITHNGSRVTATDLMSGETVRLKDGSRPDPSAWSRPSTGYKKMPADMAAKMVELERKFAEPAEPRNPDAYAEACPPAAKPTPVMQQYRAAKAEYPDALLLFRMGDFYELFDADARAAAKILGLTLTARDKVTDMAGFPHHQLEAYLRKLLEAGQKVAIAEYVAPELAGPQPQKPKRGKRAN